MSISIDDLASLDFSDIATGERLPPVTPGDILRHEFMAPLGLSARALAREIAVPPQPRHWHHQRGALHHGGYRAAPGRPLRHVRRVLDDCAGRA